MAEKIYAGILVDRVRRVTEGLPDDQQGSITTGRGYLDKIFTLKQIGGKAREKKRSVYVGFMNLEKAYNKVNREALWQVLGMYAVGDKLLSGIKSMYVNSLVCLRVKRGDNECFRIESSVGQDCVMFSWLFNVYMDAVMKEVKRGMGWRGVRLLEKGKEWRLPGLLQADDLILCGESEEDLKVMMGRFVDM